MPVKAALADSEQLGNRHDPQTFRPLFRERAQAGVQPVFPGFPIVHTSPYRKVLTCAITNAILHTDRYGGGIRRCARICVVTPQTIGDPFAMLKAIAPDIWHLQHDFVASGLRVSSRMTVVRLHDSSLWLHSPVPLSTEVRSELATLGEVRYIVAPSKTHHLFASKCLAAFPGATLFGAPGLRQKRPDLTAMRE